MSDKTKHKKLRKKEVIIKRIRIIIVKLYNKFKMSFLKVQEKPKIFAETGSAFDVTNFATKVSLTVMLTKHCLDYNKLSNFIYLLRLGSRWKS